MKIESNMLKSMTRFEFWDGNPSLLRSRDEYAAIEHCE